MGNLLLAADFQDAHIPGWKVYSWEKPAEFTQDNGIPEWCVTLPPSPDHMTAFLLATPGILDDFDVCVSLRFLAGDKVNFFAGFDLRAGEDGYYQVVMDASGNFRAGWFEKTKWAGDLVKWTAHPSLRNGFDMRNTLRVLLHGTQMRIYLNGVLATSLHDSRFTAGKLRLFAATYELEMRLAVSNLQVREVRTV